MAYPFVQAFNDYGRRKGPAKAFVVHMAEGGGTVGYLSRKQPHNVSVHYVIEYSGRIVQMLRENRASGSIRPSAIRTTDDPDRFFGATRAKAVLGSWWRDPNSAVISLEIEGFAKTGPNDAQCSSLCALIEDVRSRHPNIGLLAHRDFASYKGCPGKHIPWDRIGGHGPFAAGTQPVDETPEDEVVRAFPVYEQPTKARMKNGAWLYQYSDLRADPRNIRLTERTPAQLELPYVGTFSKEVRIVAYEPVGPPDPNGSSLAMFARASDITATIPSGQK